MGYIFLAFLFFYSPSQDKMLYLYCSQKRMYKENHIMQSVFCKQTSDDDADWWLCFFLKPLQIRSIRTYPVPSCEKVEQMTPAPTVPVLIETRNGRGTIEVLPDSGADICAAGFNFLYKLGENEKNLSESLISPRAVNGTKLQPVGFLRAKVYLGHRVTGD